MKVNGIVPQPTDPRVFTLPSGEDFELKGREIRYAEKLTKADRHLAWYEVAE